MQKESYELIMQQRDGSITRINTNELPRAPREGREAL